MDKNFEVIISFLKNILRRPRVVTMFINTIFKDSKNVKRSRNYVSTCNLYLYLYREIC